MIQKKKILTILISLILILIFLPQTIGNQIDINKNHKISNIQLTTNSERDFHSYDSLTTELQTIAANYPDITNLYSLGKSVDDRDIWGLKITNNPDIEEDEPEVRICGAHHGNEYMSFELPLLLAWLLVENYTIDPYITDLVNNREIWIIPLVNPDGREAGSRYNSNGVDLNRDYGYMWDGEGGSSSPFSQPETRIIREHALDNNFGLSLSFHCSGDIVNYIWNYKGDPVPDNDITVYLSEQYGDHNDYWVVEGYDWYQTKGDLNDFSYGCRGDIDTTIEVQTSNIPGAWDLNRDATIEIIDAVDMGVRGIVTDINTGLPIAATVWVDEAYWPCFTDPKIGDYHKLLLPGTYNFNFRANGYQEKSFAVEVFDTNTPTVLNVALEPSNEFYAYQVTSVIFYDPYGYPNNYNNNPTEATSALGPPDGIYASLGEGGEIILDMGENCEIINGEGNDFTIIEGDETPDEYVTYISDNWDGPWISLGINTGTSSFDLESIGSEIVRYIRIVDADDGDPYEDNPGFDLDAIQSLSNNLLYYVDDDYDNTTEGWGVTHFKSIQNAINNSQDNGIINIKNGIYYENILVNKSIDLIGEDKENTIIIGDGSIDAILLTSDNVKITGFTIENSVETLWFEAGIAIYSDNNIIYDNILNNNKNSIVIENSENNTISNNKISNNSLDILFDNSHFNTIKNNLITQNRAIHFYDSNNNIIDNNEIIYNDDGIYISSSHDNNFINNNISNNGIPTYLGDGMYLEGNSSGNNIVNNNISANQAEGIWLYQTVNNNTIKNNDIKNHDIGIRFNIDTRDNNIYNNNLMENIDNAEDRGINNWDNGYKGNYWSNYDEISEGAYDNNSDGIIDNPYNVPLGINFDNYPMLNPYLHISFKINNTGWNLFTVPIQNNWKASTLAENITGCQIVSYFDAQIQTYNSYIVGVSPPSADFAIENGYSYFIVTKINSSLSISGMTITSVNISLYVNNTGWNMIGWYQNYSTTASGLASGISNCSIVSIFEASVQTYNSYIVGVSPPSADFSISKGKGVFVIVDEETYWYGN